MFRLKFGVLAGLAFALALTLACGVSDEELSQLDYPDSWSDGYVQRVHEEFGGIYEGLEFNRSWYRYVEQSDGTYDYENEKIPPVPDEYTLEQLRAEYDRLISAYKYIAQFYPGPVQGHDLQFHGILMSVILPDANGEPVLDENGSHVHIALDGGDIRPEESILDAFLSGGIDIPEYVSQYTTEIFLPWEDIIWGGEDLYISLLNHHYELGSESPLCDVLARESREPIENFCRG